MEKKELVVVNQELSLTDSMQLISDELKAELEVIRTLEVNSKSLQECKKVRTYFNKMSKEYNDKKIEIKKLVMKPYTEFEEKYNKMIRDVIVDGVEELDQKIKEQEKAILDEKVKNIKEYFEKLNKYDFITFESLNLKIGLSGTEVSFKKKVDEFINKLNNDIELIKLQTNSSEIMLEYKTLLDVSAAILKVNEHHSNIEKLNNFNGGEFNKEINIEQIEKEFKEEFEDTIKEDFNNFECDTNFEATFKVVGNFKQIYEIRKFIKGMEVECYES